MLSALRSVLAFAIVSALAVLAVPACSQQGEGERCDYAKNGHEDCESGLTCVVKNSLLENITDRCCPAAGTETSSRCRRGSGTGTAGSGGSSNVAGTGGTDTGGTDTGGTDTGGTDTGGTDTGGTDTGGTDTGGSEAGGTGAVSAGGDGG